MEPFSRSYVINAPTRPVQWAFAREEGKPDLILVERDQWSPEWTPIASWPIPPFAIEVEAWLKEYIVPALNRLQQTRHGVTAIAPPTAASMVIKSADVLLRERLDQAVQYNATMRVFAYVRPEDPNNV